MKSAKSRSKTLSTHLQIENLVKNYGLIKAVNNISFTAGEGEIIALLGPNGAGKSTLMNMIAGYLAPTSGDIMIMGKNIREHPLYAKEHIGFLPEGSPLYPDLTVKEFLNYMRQLRGLPKSILEEVVATAKIEQVVNQRVETLSKGYQRRVGFAQSILSNPPILLLDEPTDGLDPNQKHHIRELIRKMGKRKTIIISTHLLEEAETVCNRVLLINKGKILGDGTAEEIIKQSRTRSLENAFRKLTAGESEDE